MNVETYTGVYGFVLILDEAIEKKAKEFSRKYRFRSQLSLKANIPHVALYHARFIGLPKYQVVDMLDKLTNITPTGIVFENLSMFKNKFLFWDSVSAPSFMAAHEAALTLSAHADLRAGAIRREGEELEYTYREKENLKRYGYPLVKSLWRPHITLGYYPLGKSPVREFYSIHGKVTAVAFVEIGKLGVVKEIIDLRFLN